MLTLDKALKTGKLSEFIDQCEADGIGPADRAQFEKLVERVTAPRPEGQTSHSPDGDGSHGK